MTKICGDIEVCILGPRQKVRPIPTRHLQTRPAFKRAHGTHFQGALSVLIDPLKNFGNDLVFIAETMKRFRAAQPSPDIYTFFIAGTIRDDGNLTWSQMHVFQAETFVHTASMMVEN